MNISSDTEDAHENFSKSSNNLKQSNSFGNLTDSNRNLDHSFNIDSTTMKRNKSFWRFSKSEDILEGMALWKHRDLVTIDLDQHNENDQTLKKHEKPNKKMSTLQKKTSRMEEPNRKMDTLKSEKRDRGQNVSGNFKEHNKNSSNRNLMHRGDDDEIYDESPKRRNDIGPSKSHSQKTRNEKNRNNNSDKFSREQLQDTNFYDDDVMHVIKTVKRKEILKQYYSSGTDTELSSSDPYDCIVVDDHLVPTTSNFRGNRNSYAGETDKRGSVYSRSNKHESGTMLPRTKLSKASRNDTEAFESNDRMSTMKSSKHSKQNNFGPWSNLWPDE